MLSSEQTKDKSKPRAMSTTEGMLALYEKNKAEDLKVNAAILGKMQITDMFSPSEIQRVKQALGKMVRQSPEHTDLESTHDTHKVRNLESHQLIL